MVYPIAVPKGTFSTFRVQRVSRVQSVKVKSGNWLFWEALREIQAVFEEKSKKKYLLVVKIDSTGYFHTETLQMLRTVDKN